MINIEHATFMSTCPRGSQALVLALVLLVVSCPARADADSTAPRPLVDPRYPVIMDDWPILVDHRHQLFLDDEIIARKNGVQRVVETARKHPDNPIVRPEHEWEDDMVLLYGSVLRDAESGQFRMWYLARNFEDKNPMRTIVCYADSDDGIRWRKPSLGLVDYKGSTDNNIVMTNHGQGLDTIIVFDDPNASGGPQRYKLFIYHFRTEEHPEGLYLYTSADGIHWTKHPRPIMYGAPAWPKNADNQFRGDVMRDGIGDVTWISYDHALDRYVANLKTLVGPMRSRMMTESSDLIHWSRPRVIMQPDEHDGGIQLYGMVDFPYESQWLGVVQRYMAATDLRLDLIWASSRDGRHWSRVEPRRPFIAGGEQGAWDHGNISPANNPPIRVGDELWFYYGGRDTTHNIRPNIGAIGLATLPDDRFVALEADVRGEVLTRPLQFNPGSLHVNADARGGSLRVEVVDLDGRPIPGYEVEVCQPLDADDLDHTITWHNERELEVGQDPVRLRFVLERAKLYSFWIE